MSEIEGTAYGVDALTDLTRELLEDDETAYAYLLEAWLAQTTGKLREARREAGLTQAEVAERLGTKQPAIARLERDHEGRSSLRRFLEYALACGVLPFELSLESAEEMRRYALDNPDEPITETAYENWLYGTSVEETALERQAPAKVRGLGFEVLPRDVFSHHQTYTSDFYFGVNRGNSSGDRLAGSSLPQYSEGSGPCLSTGQYRANKNRAVPGSRKTLDDQELKLAS